MRDRAGKRFWFAYSEDWADSKYRDVWIECTAQAVQDHFDCDPGWPPSVDEQVVDMTEALKQVHARRKRRRR
jgi:hypothetical protein